MKVERLIYKTSNRCLNIVAGKVESLRINDSTENTVRVYDNGCIGVEGALGEVNLDELQVLAAGKLSQGIAYPETHEQPQSLYFDTTMSILPENELIARISRLMTRLSGENPEFLFSNKIMLNSSDSRYESSDGVTYRYKGNQFVISLTIKHKGSANIMDESYGCESDNFSENQICRDVKLKCDAFLKKLPHVEDDTVTIIGDFEPIQYAIQHLVADMYFNNASLFAGKLGKRLFNKKFNMVINRNPTTQVNLEFFDAEGVVNKNYISYIVKNGVLERLFTCKRSAAQYNTENLGSASASYNGVPNIGASGFEVENTAETLSDLVEGQAIYLSVTSGGDMTPSGDISMPTMVAYLYENGKLLGRLPEFAVSVNIFDLLNKGFVGVCDNGLFKFGKHKYFVYKAKLVNKQ
ncbi:MAG: hypothetical protein J1G02_02215 [Clostridiales bacterium]|nr:hypothetical protein [Clostridiales bacterium]